MPDENSSRTLHASRESVDCSSFDSTTVVTVACDELCGQRTSNLRRFTADLRLCGEVKFNSAGVQLRRNKQLSQCQHFGAA